MHMQLVLASTIVLLRGLAISWCQCEEWSLVWHVMVHRSTLNVLTRCTGFAKQEMFISSILWLLARRVDSP